MIGKIVGAAVGERVARRYGSGARGALIGALVPMVMKRVFSPLGLALAGGYAAKKIYDSRRQNRAAT